jgi:hypothetical protein
MSVCRVVATGGMLWLSQSQLSQLFFERKRFANTYRCFGVCKPKIRRCTYFAPSTGKSIVTKAFCLSFDAFEGEIWGILYRILVLLVLVKHCKWLIIKVLV